MDLKFFETFLVVGECLSFTQAARKLETSKTAISNQIRKLEAQLGVDLLTRTTRSVSLTDEGRLLMAQCQQLQSTLEDTRALLKSFHHKPSGTLYIQCNPYRLTTGLLNKIQQYQADFQDMKVIIESNETMVDLKHSKIDVMIGVNWPAPVDTVRKKIGETRYCLCASPAYIAEKGMPTTIEALQAMDFINHAGRPVQNQLISLRQKRTIMMQSKLSMQSGLFLRQAVLAGLGIAQFHDYMVQDALDNQTLVELMPELFKPKKNLYLYFAKQRFIEPKIRQFIHLFD